MAFDVIETSRTSLTGLRNTGTARTDAKGSAVCCVCNSRFGKRDSRDSSPHHRDPSRSRERQRCRMRPENKLRLTNGRRSQTVNIGWEKPELKTSAVGSQISALHPGSLTRNHLITFKDID